MQYEFIEKSYELFSEFSKFILTISNKNDVLNLNLENVFVGLLFEDTYNMEKLIKTSNYFTNFSNISQITKNICEFLDKDQYLLQTKENYMLFQITNPIKNLTEINFNLPYIENAFNDEINDMIKKREKNLLLKWVNPNKNLKLNLLYKASKDGDTPQIFHHKVDGKKNTITIILTDKNFRCGGYISNEWKSEGNFSKDDKNSFLFSLDKKEMYVNNDGYNNFNDKNYGPTFGKGYDLCIGEKVANFFTSNKHFSEFPHSYGDRNKVQKYGLTGGFRNFIVKDIEVYEIVAVEE